MPLKNNWNDGDQVDAGDMNAVANDVNANTAKLATVAAGADDVNTTTVDAAGGVLNSDTSTAAMQFVVDEDDMSSNSATKVPTQQSVKTYVDTAVSGVGSAGDLGVVVVQTGTEARPSGPTVVLWVDPRVDATRPDNMGEIDLWFTPNGVAAGDTTAPSVPTGLASTDVQTDQFTVAWDASTDDVGVTGYQLRLNGGTPVSVSDPRNTFTGLTAETGYDVDVRARDAAGNWSAYCTPVTVTTDAEAPTIPSPTVRYNFNEGSGSTVTSEAGGYTLVDRAGGSGIAWGSGTVTSWVGNYLTGQVEEQFSDYTIALDFVFTGGPVSEATYFWHRNGTGQYLNILPDGRIRFYGASTVTSASSITFSGTKRVVITQVTGTLKIYVDGVEFISSPQTNAYSRNVGSDVFSSSPANVGVDCLRAWLGTALDATQVAALGA